MRKPLLQHRTTGVLRESQDQRAAFQADPLLLFLVQAVQTTGQTSARLAVAARRPSPARSLR